MIDEPSHSQRRPLAGTPYRPRPLVTNSPITSTAPASSLARGGGKKEILCAFGIDVDAVAVRLAAGNAAANAHVYFIEH